MYAGKQGRIALHSKGSFAGDVEVPSPVCSLRFLGSRHGMINKNATHVQVLAVASSQARELCQRRARFLDFLPFVV